jgi:hypothetical protein
MLQLRLEDVVNKPAAVASKVAAFLELAMEPNAFAEITADASYQREPVRANTLTPTERDIVNRLAEEWGYSEQVA